MRNSTAALGLLALTLAACAANPAPSTTVPVSEPQQVVSEVPANVTLPKLIKKVEVEYPATLRRRGIQGIVVVETTIDTQGIPREVRVIKSDHPELSALAVQAVQQWRFQPGTMDGKPVDVLFNSTVRFALNH